MKPFRSPEMQFFIVDTAPRRHGQADAQSVIENALDPAKDVDCMCASGDYGKKSVSGEFYL